MSAPTLFDPEGLLEDIKLTAAEGPMMRPARVGFLAGMLAVWTLGAGRKLTEAEKERLMEIARRCLTDAEHALTDA